VCQRSTLQLSPDYKPMLIQKCRPSACTNSSMTPAFSWISGGREAERLGWTAEELFGLHPRAPMARYLIPTSQFTRLSTKVEANYKLCQYLRYDVGGV
jgi:hypothetical protein